VKKKVNTQARTREYIALKQQAWYYKYY
jgi:hypothetical protein